MPRARSPGAPHHDSPLQALLAALVGEGTVGQVQSAQIEPPAVPEHLDGHILPRPAQEKNRIALEIDAVPVDAVEFVAGQQAGFLNVLRPRQITADHRRGRTPRHGKEHQQDHQPRHKIQKCSGHQNDEFFPRRLTAEGPGIVRGLLLTLHGAEPSDGQGPERVGRLPPLSWRAA